MDERKSREAASGSLVSAARYVRRSAQAVLESGEQYVNRLQAERDALRHWARCNDKELTSGYCGQYHPIGAGAEHRVFFDVAQGLAIKATHPNRFGWSVEYEGANATPFEYLRRLIYQNWFFGDRINLVGVVTGDDHLEVITSQPWITGMETHPEATEEQIVSYFADLGFVPTRLFPSRSGFYNKEVDIVAADAHPRNILVSEFGQILPIDVVMGRPGPRLARLLALEFPPQPSSGAIGRSFGPDPVDT